MGFAFLSSLFGFNFEVQPFSIFDFGGFVLVCFSWVCICVYNFDMVCICIYNFDFVCVCMSLSPSHSLFVSLLYAHVIPFTLFEPETITKSFGRIIYLDKAILSRGSTKDGIGVHDSIVNQLLTKMVWKL